MRARHVWAATTLALVAIGIGLRCVINFWHTYPPGIDAAYYPLQTRYWLEHGRLLYDDLPLIFWINAAVAKVLAAFGWDIDAAVLLASRIVDCVLPPWIVVFVMALGYHWSGGRRAALAGCAAAAIVTMLWPPAMLMLSEFEKNSLGLVWMAAAVWAGAAAMRLGGPRRWLTLAALVALSALTHVGAFGVTVLIVGLSLAFWIGEGVIHRGTPVPWKPIAVAVIVGAVIVALMAGFEPRRTASLLAGPVTLFRNAIWGPASMSTMAWTAVAIVCGPVTWRLWRDRGDLSRADAAVTGALVVSSIFLVVPKREDYLFRLGLMASVPLATALAFLMSRRAVAGRSRWVGISALVVAIAVATMAFVERMGAPGQLVELAATSGHDAGAELRGLREHIPDPDSTLVMSSHGLEWWAGYFLHTPVRLGTADRDYSGAFQPDKIPADAFTRYRRVLFLRRLLPSNIDERAPAPADAFAHPALTRIYAGPAFELYEVRTTAIGRN